MKLFITFSSLLLRYYATFKVRKFESLFYKINACLRKTATSFGFQVEQIFSVNLQYTYFSILGVVFEVPFLCYFQKLQFLVVKKFWTNFCCIVLLYLWAQKVSQIFKILFQTRDINIFDLHGVVFSRYVQLKSSFFDEKKHWWWNLRHSSVEKLSRIKGKFHHWDKLELCKVIPSVKLPWKR